MLGIKQTKQFLKMRILENQTLKSEQKFQNMFNDMNRRSTLGRANDLLLTKQFKEYLELCLRCIADLKSVQESAR